MDDSVDAIRLEEYRALRATIRERGNMRVIAAVITFSVWGAALLAACAWFVIPVFSLIPLTVLTAGFEIVFATHVGVERIGRYLQTRYEARSSGEPMWEQSIERFAAPSSGAHPLFPAVFIAACLVNLLVGVLLRGDATGTLPDLSSPDAMLFAAIHVAVIARVLVAARFAAGQRSRDQAEFERSTGTR